MKIQLINSTKLALSAMHEDGFNISSEDTELHYGAMEMFVSSLAMCTFSVLASYAQRIDAGVETLTMHMKWKYAEKPHRIDKVDMDIRWPDLPESRLDAAMRAAATCTLHRTLEHSVDVDTMIDR